MKTPTCSKQLKLSKCKKCRCNDISVSHQTNGNILMQHPIAQSMYSQMRYTPYPYHPTQYHYHQQYMLLQNVTNSYQNPNFHEYNQRRKKKQDHQFQHYCWIHGKCNYPSSQCFYKMGGHKGKATASNHVRESMRNVH